MIKEHGRVGASMCVGISRAGRSCQITDALESFLELASALQSIRPCGTDEETNIDNLAKSPFRTFYESIASPLTSRICRILDFCNARVNVRNPSIGGLDG